MQAAPSLYSIAPMHVAANTLYATKDFLQALTRTSQAHKAH